ncbi:unnamed protein product, partial [Mesorhabditis spiculigera]
MDLNGTAAFEARCRIKNNPLDILWVRLMMFALYAAVFIVAVSGNMLVVYVVTNNRRMHTVTNIFICNLAISDLLVNFTSLWLTPMYTYVGHWIWGGWVCHGLPLFQGTFIFISTLTLMAIAVDRYFVIVRNSTIANSNDRVSLKKCVVIVCTIWFVSLLLVMPYAIHMEMGLIGPPCDFHVCIERWADGPLRTVYGLCVMALQFLVPFVIIGISYARIWSFLNTHEEGISARGTIQRDKARKQRLLRMLVTMVVIFAVCWFPLNLLNLLRDHGLKPFNSPEFAFLVGHLVAMTATCWNPILYAWMNDSFRKEFMMAIPCIRQTGMARRIRTDSVPASVRINCPQSASLVENPYKYSRQASVDSKGFSIWASVKQMFTRRPAKNIDDMAQEQVLKETVVTEAVEASPTAEEAAFTC